MESQNWQVIRCYERPLKQFTLNQRLLPYSLALVKGELINTTLERTAWDKEKNLSPDRNGTHDLPSTERSLYPLSYENSLTPVENENSLALSWF